MQTTLRIFLILHLAGLTMGFIGGRVHGVVIKRLRSARAEAATMLWEFEKQASWIAFVGTGLLVVTGASMLWLYWGGPAVQPPLFWVKISLVVLVAWAEFARHVAAQRWREGADEMGYRAARWGKVSGLAAVLVVIVAVFTFR